MHDLSLFPPVTVAPSASIWARRAREKPSAPSVPTWRKSRRVIPSQVVMEPAPERSIMGFVKLKCGANVARSAPIDNPRTRQSLEGLSEDAKAQKERSAPRLKSHLTFPARNISSG
jgi:hypothetical protein